jgi:hypothetical protein
VETEFNRVGSIGLLDDSCGGINNLELNAESTANRCGGAL